jgi:hypothetical protein
VARPANTYRANKKSSGKRPFESSLLAPRDRKALLRYREKGKDWHREGGVVACLFFREAAAE